MKTHHSLLLIAISLLFLQIPLQAQFEQQNPQLPLMSLPPGDWSTAPVRLSIDDFPIVGFRFYGMGIEELLLWKEAGLNLFEGDPHAFKIDYSTSPLTYIPPSDIPTIAQEMTGGMKSIMGFPEISGGTFYINPGTSHRPEQSVEEHQLLPCRLINDLSTESSEMRYFLASNFDVLPNPVNHQVSLFEPQYTPKRDKTFAYDLLYNWVSVIGAPTYNGANPTYEWLIPSGDYFYSTSTSDATEITKNKYILLDLQVTNSTFGINRNTVSPLLPNAYCDFIYRIDDNDWSLVSSYGEFNPLFTIEYYVLFKGDGGIVQSHVVATDVINHDKYLHPIFPPNEKSETKSFPNGKFIPSKPTSHSYAVSRTVIPLVTSFDSAGKTFIIDSFKCRVKTEHIVNLYVRGLRVRSEQAEKILSGSLDADLKAICDHKKTALQLLDNGLTGSQKVTAWDNTFMFKGGGEPTVDGFRIYAYIDNLCYNRIGKHIIPFLTNNAWDWSRPEWYRAIYEEQTGKIPPPINMEDLERFDNPSKNFPIPADGIDFRLRNSEDFYKHDDFFSLTGFRPEVGLPLGTTIKPVENQNGIYGYSDYTQRMQVRLNDKMFIEPFKTDDPNLINQPHTFARCAAAINPPWAQGITSEYGKYFAHLSVITYINDLDFHKASHVDADKGGINNDGKVTEGPLCAKTTLETISDKVFNMMRTEFSMDGTKCTGSDEDGQRYPGDLTRNNEVSFHMDYKDYRSLPKGINSPNGNEENLSMFYRPTLKSELRAQLWNAICYGAQGIVFNCINTDLGGDIGWCLNKWTDLNNVEHNTKDFNYPFDDNIDPSDHSFYGFIHKALIGTCDPFDPTKENMNNWGDHPPIDTVASAAEQTGAVSDSKWTDHVIQATVTDATFGCNPCSSWSIYRTIPFYNLLGTLIDDQNLNTIATTAYNGEIHAHYILSKPVTVGTWTFINEVDPSGVRKHKVATRKEFLNFNDSRFSFEGFFDEPNDTHAPAPYYTWQYHYPSGPEYWHSPFIRPKLYIPTYYGFKERDLGARQAIADIVPIGKHLTNLRWIAGVNYSNLFDTRISDEDRAVTRSDFEKFPFIKDITYTSPYTNTNQDIHSWKLKRLGAPWQLRGTDNDDLYPDNTRPIEEREQDLNTETYFEFGLFKNPDDVTTNLTLEPSELYVAIANKRTWPMKMKTDGSGEIADIDPTSPIADPYYYMGGVDARRFSFKIDRSKFKDGENYNLFSVLDLRTGNEKIISHTTPFERDFEPGEGTLLRISPTFGLAAGKADEDGMAYNNGHRIADITIDAQAPGRKIMVWENSGNIEYRITNSPVSTDSYFENYIAPEGTIGTIAGVIESPPNIDFQNPSVASFQNNIMIVYSSETEAGARQVIAKWGQLNGNTIDWIDQDPNTTPIKEPFVLDAAVPKDVVNQPNQKITPVVTPSLYGFFCAWSRATGAIGHNITASYVELVDDGNNNSIVSPIWQNTVNEPNAVSSVFPTVASRNESDAVDDLGQQVTDERFHLAWEEQWADGQAQIYYTRFHFDRNANTWTTLPNIERVSKLLSGCKHHHPNIAVKNEIKAQTMPPTTVLVHGEPIITWEREESIYHNDNSLQGVKIMVDDGIQTVPVSPPVGRSVIVRERYTNNLGWSSFTSIDPITNNLPLPLVKTGVYTMQIPGFPTPWFPKPLGLYHGVTYMDSIKKEVKTSKYSASLGQPVWNTKFNWNHFKLPEAGAYPNLSLNYLPVSLNSLNTLTFRGNHRFYDADNSGDYLYDARVTAPSVDAILKPSAKKVSVRTLNAMTYDRCKGGFTYSVGRPIVVCYGCTDSVNNLTPRIYDWTPYDIAYTTNGYYIDNSIMYDWAPVEDSIRTENFAYAQNDTVQFDRLFLLDDTAYAKMIINDSTAHQLTFSVLLKDSATSQTLAVLDQITIDSNSIDIAVQRFNEGAAVQLSSFTPMMPSPTTTYLPQGPGRHIKWVANSAPPSGKGYITIKAVKDEAAPISLSQTNGEYDGFDVIVSNTDSSAYKRPGNSPVSVTENLVVTVHPNPFSEQTVIDIDAPVDLLLNVTIFDALGRQVTTFINGTSDKTHYSFTLEGKQYAPGTYFVRAQCGNYLVTKQIQLLK